MWPSECALYRHLNKFPYFSNVPCDPPPPKRPVKTELQVIRLKEESQTLILETLRAVRPNYQIKEMHEYKAKGQAKNVSYWQDRGTLVVVGGCDYSHRPELNTTEDALKSFAVMKLERFGFPRNHCAEALDHHKGDVEQALYCLFDKYFPRSTDQEELSEETNEEDLQLMREDELSSLQSIYDKLFEEKEKNRIWQYTLELPFLSKFSAAAVKREKEIAKFKASRPAPQKSKEPCPYYLKGHCKFGNKCRMSHLVDTSHLQAVTAPDQIAMTFTVEIRFPEKCKYPHEAPVILLTTVCKDFPPLVLLRLTKMLVDKARELAQDGMSSLYFLCDMLHNEEKEIVEYLERCQENFLHPLRSLFYSGSANDDESSKLKKLSLATHYRKGQTSRDDPRNQSKETRLKENLEILRRFSTQQKSEKYEAMQKVRRSLPAWDKREEILGLLSSNQVIVISGETGCGKSTQVPQFLLDDWMERLRRKDQSHVEIVCTQPRRLSAIGVAQRVSDERTDRLGNTVGYQIRLENKVSASTRLTFCTTGILLRRLQGDPLLESVTHIIVDEVHERSEESDFLLLILKELLVKRKDLKVILMSATLNAELFSKYFVKAPVLEIPGRTFPVEQFFLEDILERSKFVMEADSQFCKKLTKKEQEELMRELEFADVTAAGEPPGRSIRDESLKLPEVFCRFKDYSKATCKSIFLMDPFKVNPELIEAVLKYIVSDEHSWPKEGSILIFLPGLAEIMTVYDALSDSREFSSRSGKYVIVPLHSTLSSAEQSLVFDRPPPGKRKIVLSTNVAETSVTIDDCVFVIDCGHMKEKRFDPNRNMESLELVWVSRANANQRKGRAGRVMPGVAIHLYSRHRYQNHFLAQPIPEIHRVPLEQLLLRVKTLPNFDDRTLEAVMKGVIEPPAEEGVSTAITRLQDVGAFDDQQSLTPLGVHLAALPVDVRIGKLMLFGAIFQCLDSVLTMAACLSHKSPFVAPFGKRNEADNRKKQFAVSNSDHLTVLNAYKRWRKVNKDRNRYAAKVFADENYLSMKTLETLVEMKYQFLELLISIGFVPVDFNPKWRRDRTDMVLEVTGPELNKHNENSRLLAALLCAALYPNVVRVMTPDKTFTAGMGGAVPQVPLASELRFKTREDGYVAIHPSSVNANVGQFLSPFLIFQEKVKTSRIFIRESTMVPILPLVLFSGSEVHIERHGEQFVVLLENGWIILQAATHEIAELLKALREELNKLLEEKIKDPCLNLLHHDQGLRIISTIIHLFTKE